MSIIFSRTEKDLHSSIVKLIKYTLVRGELDFLEGE